jgi:hypothetical protein
MKMYLVRLRHDTGFITVEVFAETTEQAIKLVCDYEKAPLRAVRSVKLA